MTTNNKILSSVLVSMFTLAAASRAHAQQAPAAADETVATTAAPDKAGIGHDPNIDRGFLLPTAMTQPKGSLTYNNYELLLHGLTYGITDNVQASVTVLSPIVDDMPFLGNAAVKAHVAVSPRLHLAAQGSVGYGHVFANVSGDVDSNRGNLVNVGAGGFVSYCLREDCSSLVSGSATYSLGMASGVDERLHLILYGASIVHRVGSHVKLLGEITSATVASSDTPFDQAPGLLASYGVRFHTNDVAADIGFVKPFSNEGDTGDILMGLPFVNVSYRWQ